MASSTGDFSRSWYQFQNAFGLAFDSIRAHKLRSFLTLLGVIIGVASVIMVGAAIDGLGVYAEESTSKAFGSESFMVAQIVGGRLTRRELYDKLKYNKPIRVEDARYLEMTNGNQVMYSPYRQTVGDVKRENYICEDTTIIGVAADMASIRDVTVVDGRFFTQQEDQGRRPVAVIGEDVKTTLFPSGGSPIDGILRVNGIEFRVVGVQEKLGSVFGRSQDKVVWIPITMYNRLYGVGQGMAVFGRARAGSGLTLDGALDLTRVALRTRFKLAPGKADKFDVLTPDAIRGFIDNLLSMVAAIVVPVTCISLLVGGIVIMNIMLVSVTERTREIGIRKAVGARQSDVMLQILIEAVALSVLGGSIGVALGAAFTAVLSRAFEISMQITWFYVLLALVVSSVVGIASGWYPAARAAKLDPVVALRAE